MKNLVDINGHINVENLIMNSPSFKKIMEDNVITDEERAQQAERVVALLNELNETCSEEQADLLRRLMAEFCVLVGINVMY